MPIETPPSLPVGGRANQKLRTRRELLRGARELMQETQVVTVAAAAKRVGISTATAYRYFSDPETLRVEAVIEMDLGAANGVIDELHGIYKDLSDPTERLIALHRVLIGFVRANETAYRLYLAKEHEQVIAEKKDRNALSEGSQRLALIKLALAPLRDARSPEAFQTLVHACAAASGPEPYFVLKDFAKLPDAEIDSICELNLRTLARTLIGDQAA